MRMEPLREYLNSLGQAGQAAFAIECGTTIGYLRKALSVGVALNPLFCVSIERNSLGAVRRWDLRPNDWSKIWPELIGIDGAPPVPMVERAA